MENIEANAKGVGLFAGVPREAKVALWLLVAMNLLNLIDRQILAAVVPMIRTEFLADGSKVSPFVEMLLSPLAQLLGNNPENAQLGLLAMAFMVSYTIGAPLLGALPIRRWFIIGGGVIVWSLATGLSGLATGFGMLLLARCLVGFGEAAFAPVAPSIIADHFPVSTRGRVMPFFYLAIPLGSALGFVLGGQIAGSFGWRALFLFAAVPGILLGLIAFMMRDTRTESKEAQAPGVSRMVALKALMKNKSFVLVTLGEAAMTFAIGGMVFWVPSYINEYRQAGSLAQVNLIFGGIVVVAGTSATIIGALVAEKLKKRWSGSYFIVSGVAMLIGCPIFITSLFVPFPVSWIFMFLATFCLLFNTGPANTIIANVSHSSIRTFAYAVNIFTIHALGDVISPLIIGAVADASNMNVAFLVVSGFFLVGGVFWLFGARHLEGDTERASQGLEVSGVTVAPGSDQPRTELA